MRTVETTLDEVRTDYGDVLESTRDLRTSACCTTDALPTYVKRILTQIDPEILDRYHGYGSPIPTALEGCTVLDLGCGTGRDVYVAPRLVGPEGAAPQNPIGSRDGAASPTFRTPA